MCDYMRQTPTPPFHRNEVPGSLKTVAYMDYDQPLPGCRAGPGASTRGVGQVDCVVPYSDGPFSRSLYARV